MIRREGILYHIDSLAQASNFRRNVHTLTPEEFCEYVQHFAAGHLIVGERQVGGLYQIYYVGRDLNDVVMAA